MEKTIQKAIEGGYNIGPIEVDMVCDNKQAHYFIDPLFWQAYGKACGKENEYIEFYILCSVSSQDFVKTIWWIA